MNELNLISYKRRMAMNTLTMPLALLEHIIIHQQCHKTYN